MLAGIYTFVFWHTNINKFHSFFLLVTPLEYEDDLSQSEARFGVTVKHLIYLVEARLQVKILRSYLFIYFLKFIIKSLQCFLLMCSQHFQNHFFISYIIKDESIFNVLQISNLPKSYIAALLCFFPFLVKTPQYHMNLENFFKWLQSVTVTEMVSGELSSSLRVPSVKRKEKKNKFQWRNRLFLPGILLDWTRSTLPTLLKM